MKTKKYLLSIISALFLFIFTQGASAHMLFTYETAEMKWIGETARLQDGTLLGLDYFWNDTFKLDVTFITPDINFDLDEMEVEVMEFDNPVVDVSVSNWFNTVSVERSWFWVEAYKVEGEIYTDWRLTFDIVDNSLPNGTALSASITSHNYSDYMTLSLDNYLYSRRGFEALIYVDAEFWGEYEGRDSNEYPGFGRFAVTFPQT